MDTILPTSHLPDLLGIHEQTVAKMLRAGRFGPVTVLPGFRSHFRVVSRAAVESVRGPVTDAEIAEASARHAERMRAKSAAARKRRLCGAR